MHHNEPKIALRQRAFIALQLYRCFPSANTVENMRDVMSDILDCCTPILPDNLHLLINEIRKQNLDKTLPVREVVGFLIAYVLVQE